MWGDGPRPIGSGTNRGARGGTRTPDAHLRTVALYPLSYTGTSDKYNSGHHASTAYAVHPQEAPPSSHRVYVHPQSDDVVDRDISQIRHCSQVRSRITSQYWTQATELPDYPPYGIFDRCGE